MHEASRQFGAAMNMTPDEEVLFAEPHPMLVGNPEHDLYGGVEEEDE